MRHDDIQIRRNIRDDEAAALRAAGFRLEAAGQVVHAVAPDGGSTYYVDGVKIAHHPGDPNLKNYSVASRRPALDDLFGRACFNALEDAVAYVKATH